MELSEEQAKLFAPVRGPAFSFVCGGGGSEEQQEQQVQQVQHAGVCVRVHVRVGVGVCVWRITAEPPAPGGGTTLHHLIILPPHKLYMAREREH